MAKESSSESLVRWQKLWFLQDTYSEFLPFLDDVMELLGFHVSEIQEDIAKYIAYGPHYLMVKAQRGQAKTSIAAAYCVWSLIHNPKSRVLIISAGGSQASDISTLIIRIIQNMDVLECLRPDIRNGDRSSVEHFDVHYTLKGVDKSPSVKCLGITANMQGNRADLLLADDVESAKNSATAIMRAQLMHLTLDFTSICSTGRILWLGTPQSEDSIYMSLPGRGVTVRVWPGRYPTPQQLQNYGDELAPLLKRRLEADPSLGTGGGAMGDQGKPIEKEGTGWLDEANLRQKELDQGESWFQLQHMLNTKLADAMRFPLKLERCVLLDVQRRAPLVVERHPDPSALESFNVHGFAVKLRRPLSLSPEQHELTQVVTYIDPAGGGVNADETAYSTVAFLNGNVYLLDIGGFPGGYDKDILLEIAKRLAVFKPNTVVIEKNMGYGAFAAVFTPILHSVHKCSVEEDLVTGQKEARIISTLEPVIGRGSLIITPSVIEQDIKDCQRYAPKDRQTYSLFFQLAKLTKARGSLVHDDRADSLEGAVRYWNKYLAIDQERQAKAERDKAHSALTADPMGRNRYSYGSPSTSKGVFAKYKR